MMDFEGIGVDQFSYDNIWHQHTVIKVEITIVIRGETIFCLTASVQKMQYQEVILLLIVLLKSQLTEESGYNCSDFHDGFGIPLEECPPAKFMLTDNLVECFSNYSKTMELESKLVSNK